MSLDLFGMVIFPVLAPCALVLVMLWMDARHAKRSNGGA